MFVGDKSGATVRLVGPVHLVRLDGGVIDLSAYLAMHDIPAVDIQRDPTVATPRYVRIPLMYFEGSSRQQSGLE